MGGGSGFTIMCVVSKREILLTWPYRSFLTQFEGRSHRIIGERSGLERGGIRFCPAVSADGPTET